MMKTEKARITRKGNGFISLSLLSPRKDVNSREEGSEALKHALSALDPGYPFPKLD
jgi:hypothetical protein